jgi:Flp pilus assembly pilin Flp
LVAFVAVIFITAVSTLGTTMSSRLSNHSYQVARVSCPTANALIRCR